MKQYGQLNKKPTKQHKLEIEYNVVYRETGPVLRKRTKKTKLKIKTEHLVSVLSGLIRNKYGR